MSFDLTKEGHLGHADAAGNRIQLSQDAMDISESTLSKAGFFTSVMAREGFLVNANNALGVADQDRLEDPLAQALTRTAFRAQSSVINDISRNMGVTWGGSYGEHAADVQYAALTGDMSMYAMTGRDYWYKVKAGDGMAAIWSREKAKGKTKGTYAQYVAKNKTLGLISKPEDISKGQRLWIPDGTSPYNLTPEEYRSGQTKGLNEKANKKIKSRNANNKYSENGQFEKDLTLFQLNHCSVAFGKKTFFLGNAKFVLGANHELYGGGGTPSDVLGKVQPKVFKYWSDLSANNNLSKIVITSSYRPGKNQYAHNDGTAFDIGTVDSAWVHINSSKTEPDIIKNIGDWSTRNRRVSQFIGPWRHYNVPRFCNNKWFTWGNNKGRNGVEKQHLDHIHVQVR